MKRLIIIALTIFYSCERQVVFEYEVFSNQYRRVLVKNYNPVTKTELESFVKTIGTKEDFDTVYIFLTAGNFCSINPEFKDKYVREKDIQNRLKWNSQDTTKILKSSYIHIGSLIGGEFIPNYYTDSLNLNNRLLK